MREYLLGAGGSVTTNTSIMRGQSDLMQRYKSTCPATCVNIQEGTTVVIKDSIVRGGIKFTQSCTADAKCLMDAHLNGVSKLIFKDTTTQNAKNASGVLDMNFDMASNYSEQDIRQSVRQSIEQTCKADTNNIQRNLTILATNSNLEGGISFEQTGNADAACVMKALSEAQLIGEGTIKTDQTTGGMDWLSMLILGGIFLAALGIIVAAFHKKKKPENAQGSLQGIQPLPQGRAKALAKAPAKAPANSAGIEMSSMSK